MTNFSDITILDIFGTSPMGAAFNIVAFVFVVFSLLFVYHLTKYSVGNAVMSTALLVYFGVAGFLFFVLIISMSSIAS
jgi:hypothetical protein